MNLKLLLRQAIYSLLANKLRSGLSILGIVIGISSVIVMLAVGEGAKQSILSSFDNVENLILIQKRYDMAEAWESQETAYQGREVFTPEIVSEIKQKVPGVLSVIPITSIQAGEIFYEWQALYGSFYGVFDDFFTAKSLEFIAGKTFSKTDIETSVKQIILWAKIAQESFLWWNELIGKTVYIWGTNFQIQWILKEKNWEVDYSIYVPITTAKERVGTVTIDKIEVYMAPDMDIETARRNLGYFLYKKSWVSDASVVKFYIETNKDILKQVNQIVLQMRLLLWAIGSIALVVWGIGIMNIMLVSVTERTREIGIRKAIGATRADILIQFLTEAILLSLIACVVALALSYGITQAITYFAPDFQAIISPQVVILASTVSIMLWIIFGITPAYKASKLKIVDTLRYE
jgi:ABC-type antimicrobial peptide transport system permease subunit